MRPPTPDAPALASTTPSSTEEPPRVSALARGLEVLSCFGPQDRSLAIPTIAERCRLPRSTVTRIVSLLADLGYLTETSPGGPFMLGIRTVALGTAALAQMDIRQQLRPAMQTLADATGTTVSLGTRNGLSMMYVEVARSASSVGLMHRVGTRLPIVGTAIGRAFLVTSTEAELVVVDEECRELDESACRRWRVERRLGESEMRQYGCTTSFGDWHPDVNAIASGLRDSSNDRVFVLSCGGVSSRASRDFLLNEVRPRLLPLIIGADGRSAMRVDAWIGTS